MVFVRFLCKCGACPGQRSPPASVSEWAQAPSPRIFPSPFSPYVTFPSDDIVHAAVDECGRVLSASESLRLRPTTGKSPRYCL